MTNKLSIFKPDLLAAGGLDSEKSGLITYTVICKNCAMVVCRLDNSVAKVPGFEQADVATNVYSLNRLAVSGKPIKFST